MNAAKNIPEARVIEDQVVQDAFQDLLKDYSSSNHRMKTEIITKAFHFANHAHAGVKRKSGEPYILHPIAVAKIVSHEMGLGSTSISAALLHDVVEDTEYTEEDLKHLFGEKIAQIVGGLTKISGGIFGDNVSLQAENFRKLLLTMNDDIRVVLIKMADRLHNMRTLGSMLPAKQLKITGETQYIYAPLAHRLGLFAIKTELEDLSFAYEHPNDYSEIRKKLLETEDTRNALFNDFAKPVCEEIDKMGIEYNMCTRSKSAYSIWNKMQKKNIPIEEVYDIFAVRIIFEPKAGVEEKNQCWDIYSAITNIYKVRPDRIRDWVSTPKANGYQALHLTVMSSSGQWIEVQIRSKRMDDIAEKGFAAHWKYKDTRVEEDTELDKWLHTITELLENPSPNAMDFLDTIKLNLYNQEISVFTPKGEIKTLPHGATALDFAFALHSDIGEHCIGAKVNRKLVPISYVLKSGDQIEILTSRSQQPQQEWLSFIYTAKARARIDLILRKKKRQISKDGEKKIIEAFKRSDLDPNLANQDKLALYYGFNKREALYYAISSGEIELPENIKKYIRDKKKNFLLNYMRQALNVVTPTSKKNSKKTSEVKEKRTYNTKKTYILKESGNERNYTIAECCKPIPGDDSLGFIDENNDVIVHKRSCPIATMLKSGFGSQLLSTEWSNHTSTFEAAIELGGVDSKGVLNEVTKIISGDFNVNITKLLVETKDGFFKGRLEIGVHDLKDVQKLCKKLSKIKNVKVATRVNNTTFTESLK